MVETVKILQGGAGFFRGFDEKQVKADCLHLFAYENFYPAEPTAEPAAEPEPEPSVASASVLNGR